MVDLGDQSEPVVIDAFDHPQLPERLAPIDRSGDDAAGHLLQLGLAPGSGERAVTQVIVEREVLIVDPDRMTIIRDVVEALPVAGDVLQLGLDVAPDPLDVDPPVLSFQRRRVEERHPGHMHVAGRGLQGEEGGVEVGERFVVEVGHGVS
jgi:hypothetical protein